MAATGLALPAAGADKAAETAAAVRAADMAFEARAQAVGVPQAFRETMDEVDGLQFGGGAPTRGAEAIYRSNLPNYPPGSRLEWRVVDAWGSEGGDMGVTTGTFRFTGSPTAGPVVTGRYVTVWRKTAAGVWKGLIDIGNPDPR
jgi:ketosteroid isomerase-like protein